MNPIEVREPSQRKAEIRCTPNTSSAPQIYNSQVIAREHLVGAAAIYTDKAMIKYVIGASSVNENNSILKRSATNQKPNQTLTTTAVTAKSISKAVAQPDANVAVKTQEQSIVVSALGECKQQIASTNTTTSTGPNLIKLPTIKNSQTQAVEKTYTTVIKRPLPTKKVITTKPVAMQTATSSGHIIYKANNGHSSANYTDMISSSIITRVPDLPVKKLPTLKDTLKPVSKRFEVKVVNNANNRQNSDSPVSEVTQISSTVTLTKASIATIKQTKQLPSPLVTIEKKSNSTTSNMINCSKQGTIIFPNSSEPMDIVVNTIGTSKVISLGSDADETVPDTTQKSLLLKQLSPTNSNEKTPTKLPLNKCKQQSLLKVNSLARLLHTSPRTKRSKSMTAITVPPKKTGRKPALGRRMSTGSEGEVILPKTKEVPDHDPLEIKKEIESPPVPIAVSASLLCNEQIETIPSSSSNSSLEITPKKETTHTIDDTYINSCQLNTVLEMLSAFNMLSWRDRIGTCRESNMKFQLNEFNLLKIAEKCPPRDRIHTAYEKPIYERESSSNTSDYSDPLYLCRRCNCRGAAIDFLAPEFCSYECFRRDTRKRSRSTSANHDKIIKERTKKSKKSYAPNAISSVTSRGVIDLALERLAPKRLFTWSTYLSATKAKPAPIDLFLNPFPCGANLFEIGMKLEAIDPEHNSLFCVCTVVEKKGYRLKLKFDGYSKIYNFWVNADSMDIFPPGWCAKTNRVLQPPKGMNLLTFNWPTYLNKNKSTPAPRSLFTHLNSSSTTNPFKVGMRLEADDLKNTGKVCVASIVDVLDNRVLIHFDGWDESYDYWIDINSPYIHPIGWHEENGLELIPPPDWEDDFTWPEYLKMTQSEAAQPNMFSPRYPIEFERGMKLEVVDVKNPSLIRPGTVVCRNEYKLLIHLDGWPSELKFWVNDDSPEIHPIGWANETKYDLEPPPGFERPPANMPCPISGCRGIGNAKRIDINFHANEDTCPYTPKNWEVELEKPSRLEENEKVIYTGDASVNKRKPYNEKSVTCATSDDRVVQIKKEPETSDKAQHIDPVSTALPVVTDKKPMLPQFTDEIRLAREYLCDYGPRLHQNYMIWRENGNFNADAIKKNPLDWTVKDTVDYIDTKCHPIGYIFQREDIDGVALLSMHQSDLTDILKIKLGPAVKIFSHILYLRSEVVARLSGAEQTTDS